MEKELKDTVLQVADYSNEEKARLVQRMHLMFIAGFIGFVLFIVLTMLGLSDTPPYEAIASVGLGISFGMVIIGMIFTSRSASKIREYKLRLLGKISAK